MKVPNQEKIWDKIAPEWYKFKTEPSDKVLKFLEKQKGNIVDFGSGAGRHLINLKTKGKMFLVDFSKEMINLARKRANKLNIDAEFFISDLSKTPFKDNYFDAGIFTAVLHCISGKANRKKVVRELFRVLKPGAKVIVSVWNKDSSRFRNKPKEIFMSWTKVKGKRYYYLYDEKELIELFEDNGFKIKKKFPADDNIFFIAEKPN